MSKEKQSSPTFEERFKRLETIVTSLEQGELELEQSLLLFEEGIKLLNELETELDNAKTRVEHVLNKKKVDTE